MFLGRTPKKRVREYLKPAPLRETISASAFFNTFHAFDSNRLRTAPLSLASHPLLPSTAFVATQGQIERRQFSSAERTRVRRFTALPDVSFFSLTVRLDGRVLACGTSDDSVMLFGTSALKRPLARRHLTSNLPIRNHPIRFVEFLGPDVCVTGSDAGEVRVVSLIRTRGSLLSHRVSDRVRSGFRFSENVFGVGTYDGEVKVYDLRVSNTENNRVVMEWDEDGPVEVMRTLGDDHERIVSAVRNNLTCVDIRMADGEEEEPTHQQLGSVDVHAKLITDLIVHRDLESHDPFLLTSSLDSSAAVLRISTSRHRSPKILHRFRFDATEPLLSLCHIPGSPSSSSSSSSSSTTSSGSLSSHDRLLFGSLRSLLCGVSRSERTIALLRDERELVVTNCRNLVNLRLLKAVTAMKRRVNVPQNPLLEEYSSALARFEYKKVLLDSIQNHGVSDPIIVVSLIEELRSRNELINALDARNPEQLCVILRFIHANVCDERFSKSVAAMLALVLHLYGGVIGKDEGVDRWFRRIWRRVVRQCDVFSEMQKLKGLIDVLMIQALQ